MHILNIIFVDPMTQINICWSLELLILYFQRVLYYFGLGLVHTVGESFGLNVVPIQNLFYPSARVCGPWVMRSIRNDATFRMYLWDVHTCSIEFGRRDITARRKKIYFKNLAQ
jgi:hypothetical protein